MVPVTFGERLRKEREQRNITLEDVSLTTKIGTRMLRALEEEKFDQLPGGIFNKGFVRAYARCLSIDEDQAVADYLEAAGEVPSAAQQNKPAVPRRDFPETLEPVDDGRRRSFPWGTIAALILAVAIGLTIWRHQTAQDQTPVPSPAAQSQPVAGPPSSTVPAPPSSTSSSTQSMTSAAATGPSSAPAATSTEPSRALPSTTTPQNHPSTPSSGSAAVDTAPIPPGSFAVLVNAEDDSWISITADGRVLFQGMMVAPTQRLVHAQNQIAIRAGNVGALNFSFNGKKLPVQGDTGEVKTLTFSPAGLLPPAPKPPAE
jgi:cytoskeleton protein RodZ